MDALFDLPASQRPKAPATPGKRRWGGAASLKARAACRALLAKGPIPCRRCGIPITKDDPESVWDAGHPMDRAAGGADSGFEPEHKHCNRSAGGKVGARITNARHEKPSIERTQVAQWW